MPLDPNLAKNIEAMLATAARMANEGRFTAQNGRWLGSDLTIIIGVGEGAAAINRMLAGKAPASKDPRSGGSIIVPP